MGWEYSSGADMSAYKYLVIKLKRAQNCDAHLNIFTENSIWSDGYESAAFGSKKQIVVNLKTAKTKNGTALNTKNIHIVAFWGNGNGTIVVDDIYLTNNDDYSPNGISDVERSTSVVERPIYDLQGRKISGQQQTLKPGIYILNGKKVFIR